MDGQPVLIAPDAFSTANQQKHEQKSLK